MTTWSPANTSDLFLMLFNDEFQFDLIILAWAKRALRPFVNVGVVLVYGPNKYLSILTDSGQFVTLVIEFAEPYLFFVFPERRSTISR